MIYSCTHINMYLCMNVYMYVCMYVFMYTFVDTYVCVHIYLYIYTYWCMQDKVWSYRAWYLMLCYGLLSWDSVRTAGPSHQVERPPNGFVRKLGIKVCMNPDSYTCARPTLAKADWRASYSDRAHEFNQYCFCSYDS